MLSASRPAALVLLAVAAGTTAAHDIKVFSSRHVLPDGGKATVYLSWGHRVPVDELVDAAPVERYDLISPDGKSTALKKEGVSLQANAVEMKDAGVYTAVVTRKASVYTYVLGDDGDRQLKRGPKTEHAGAKIDSATRYQQAGKALVVVGKPGDAAPKPIGLPVEINPLDGPAKWTANSDIRFQILLDGKPVPTAEVVARDIGFKPEDAWSYATESNRKGEFTVRPERAGTWVVKVSVKKLTQGKTRDEYDFDSYTATLTLEVRP
ncbi:MAG: DUF4198 domain-containing protein [Gemmataceae bacterium]